MTTETLTVFNVLNDCFTTFSIFRHSNIFLIDSSLILIAVDLLKSNINLYLAFNCIYFMILDKLCRPGTLVSASRTSFKKLVERLALLYPVTGANASPTPHKERHTFTKLLSRGLHEVMASCTFEYKFPLLHSQVRVELTVYISKYIIVESY